MNFLNFFLIVCCFEFLTIINACDEFVIFPSRDVLQKSFEDADLKDFAQVTNITQVPDQNLIPYKVVIELNKALYDFVYESNCDIDNKEDRHQKTKKDLKIIDRSRGALLKILFQKDPVALAKLKKDFKF
jgi:hypothetical protein